MASQAERAAVQVIIDAAEDHFNPDWLKDISLWEDAEEWKDIGEWCFLEPAPGIMIDMDDASIQAFIDANGRRTTLADRAYHIGQVIKAAYLAGRYHNRNQLADFITVNGCKVVFE